MSQALESYRNQKDAISKELDHSISNVAADAREKISLLHGKIEQELCVLDSEKLTELDQEQLKQVLDLSV